MASRRTVRRVQVRRDAAVDAQVRGVVTGGRTGRWAVAAGRTDRPCCGEVRGDTWRGDKGVPELQIDENAAESMPDMAPWWIQMPTGGAVTVRRAS